MRGLSIGLVFAGLVALLSPASANVGLGAVGKSLVVSSFAEREVLQIRRGHRHWRRHHHHRRWGHRHHRRHWYSLESVAITTTIITTEGWPKNASGPAAIIVPSPAKRGF